MSRLGAVLFIQIVDNGGVFKYRIRQGLRSINQSGELTDGGSVVKHDNGAGLPAHAGLEVVATDNVLEQKIDEEPRLGLFQTFNLGDELGIEEKAFLPGDRVYANQWM
jgi:hypothetical protein